MVFFCCAREAVHKYSIVDDLGERPLMTGSYEPGIITGLRHKLLMTATLGINLQINMLSIKQVVQNPCGMPLYWLVIRHI